MPHHALALSGAHQVRAVVGEAREKPLRYAQPSGRLELGALTTMLARRAWSRREAATEGATDATGLGGATATDWGGVAYAGGARRHGPVSRTRGDLATGERLLHGHAAARRTWQANDAARLGVARRCQMGGGGR